MDVDAFFSAGGPLAQGLERYERRAPQISMARAVARAVAETGVLLAEAGTGTGKTLAYLAPAALSEKRIVVSTGTRNLQDQIFFKDLELLARALGRPLNAVILKGQENYLCRRRLEALVRSPAVLAFAPREVEDLLAWAAATEIGDRAEVPWLTDESPLWREVCSTAETRIGGACPAHDRCAVTRARLAAQRASIVVVNHHLYFADRATRAGGGSGILPRHDVVVFDEAHLIEDVATEFFSVKVSSSRIERLLDELPKATAASLADRGAALRVETLAKRARGASARFFDLWKRREPGRSRLEPSELEPDAHERYFKLDAAIEAIEASLRAHEADEAIVNLADRCRDVRTELAEILDVRGGGSMVRWVERKARSTALGASPIDIAAPFREGVLFEIPTVVLTSATLSAGGDFAFLRARLGIDFDAAELSCAAPFDYESQARLYAPRHLPDPRDERFFAAAIEEARALIALTGGGALVLSTSNRGMQALYDGLEDAVPGPIACQGNAPKPILLEQFVADPRSVLVATTSFWQGVDIAGDALRLVVIDKLPFASPSDPIVEARIRRLEEAGKKAFTEYQVPQAALLLKQGFGRLIRTRSDRGIVAVLDPRLRTMGYGRTFLRSLPPCPIAETFDDLALWWDEESRARIAPAER
jgi:ATP-dependent DNA helicase DinG